LRLILRERPRGCPAYSHRESRGPCAHRKPLAGFQSGAGIDSHTMSMGFGREYAVLQESFLNLSTFKKVDKKMWFSVHMKLV
jgi:hypothetical protein